MLVPSLHLFTVQINRGGEKISPLEVDAALLSLDGVSEAVAFGVPDEKYGEKASRTLENYRSVIRVTSILFTGF